MGGMNQGLIAKAIVAAAAAGLTAAITALQDGRVEGWEWAGIVGAILASRGLVWLASNAPEGVRKYTKAGVALAITAVGAISTALLDGEGITVNEALTALLALASAYIVGVTPNASDSAGELVGDPEPAGMGEHGNLAP